MTHLNTEELLDLAEGARAEAALPHLASCDACRGRLADLRAAMSAAARMPGEDDVPEPSPLFWEHFSARVREAVASEAAPETRSWVARWLSWKVAVPAVACTALVLAAALTFRPSSTPTPSLTTSVEEAASSITGDGVPDAVASSTDDPSWSLMANLAGDLDWDAAVEAGLTTSIGSVDRAVFDLSADERRELQRLLKEELGRSGV